MNFNIPVGRIKSSVLTLSSEPVKLASKEVVSGLELGRIGVIVKNNTTGNVYIGDDKVDTTSGFPLKNGESISIAVKHSARGHIYICGSGSVSIAELFE